tara:strand:+ start:148 stop:285 length:138 start_codon:yes stop_codon:yes gene_type:complete
VSSKKLKKVDPVLDMAKREANCPKETMCASTEKVGTVCILSNQTK